MKKNNFTLGFILTFQALFILLLLVSVGFVKYATLALFCLFDIIILVSLFRRKWNDAEWFAFTTFFCSLLFLMFYLFAQGVLATVIGAGIAILFIVSSILFSKEPESCQTCLEERYETIEKPTYPVYHEQHETKIYDLDELEQELDQKIFKDVEKKVKTQKKDYDKRVTDALQYELEREAIALKKAEKYVQKVEAEDEEEELEKEAKELSLAERQLEELDKLNKKYELMKEAGKLRKAEKQIEEVQQLNKQSELITEAQKIAQAQREFDIVTKALKKNTKTAKTASKSFFVSKEGTSTYHKPNCKMIAKVPKNKLNLFTTKGDASKKRLKACKSCKP